jgi:CBS domain-containing protein
MKARDIMTIHVQTLAPDSQISDAVRLFQDTRFQAFPVVAADGTLLGLLNIWNILLKVLPPYIISGDLPDVRFAPDLNQLHERLAALRSQAAAELMDRSPPQAKPGESVLECAALMLHAPHRVHLLPVVDESGQLLGVIAPWDLIKEIG